MAKEEPQKKSATLQAFFKPKPTQKKRAETPAFKRPIDESNDATAAKKPKNKVAPWVATHAAHARARTQRTLYRSSPQARSQQEAARSNKSLKQPTAERVQKPDDAPRSDAARKVLERVRDREGCSKNAGEVASAALA